MKVPVGTKRKQGPHSPQLKREHTPRVTTSNHLAATAEKKRDGNQFPGKLGYVSTKSKRG